ncbi:hypothetical protein HBH98_255910 [Parastagonospora nodorum]|nr:hypothetical protein HBH53_253490 [Parastagonospora nodorum]KAH4330997.1 hypothetical protein HBH98_255910 [Parastagonospora nodorum]KAH4354208.1 hypothetical protein HBH97_254380 [Parastagonospora nodorum]KAH5096071.1 hypothetical protein HBH71_254930 [Parastagonospora nodorum]KAH5389696.1 hypothetical protein HBI32_250970 [Parastagonospora nodorum]
MHSIYGRRKGRSKAGLGTKAGKEVCDFDALFDPGFEDAMYGIILFTQFPKEDDSLTVPQLEHIVQEIDLDQR